MKVSELIAVLQARLETHGDREVKAVWEQQICRLAPSNVWLSNEGPLFIDAEYNENKREYAADPTEGEPSQEPPK